ncbi:unnamed protein product [Diamesa tonsa]
MVSRNLSRPKTASLLDSLERCRSLIAEYRLEQRSCIGKSDELKRKKVISTLNHLLQRMKGIEAMLARYPAKEVDSKHLNCQSTSQTKPESSGVSVKFDFGAISERGNLSRPKAANIQDSLESCKNLLAEYRLEQRSCIRKQDQKKRKVLDCRIYHLLKRKKRIEAILSRYPVRILDSNHWKCQSSKQTQMKTAPTDADKLKKFSLPSHDAVESTLTRVDDQIKILEEDSTWCQSDLKISHMIELLKFKDRVENILRIYPNGELTLRKRATPAESKKPPREIVPFLNEMNKCDAEIAQIKEDPMWEMLKYKKDHLTELLQMREELEDSINENEKGKRYLEDLAKDPKIKLSGKLKLALESVDDKIAEIMDNKNWESHEESKTKMKKLRKNKQNLEDIIRHHNGEDFLKTRTENESAAVKLPHNVMQHEVKDLEKIERQITDLEKQEDTKFKNIYMDKLIRTKSNVETSIIFYKNGKEYLKQHALKKELLKLGTDLKDIDDQLAKIDESDDEKETPEEKATRKELMKNKEEIEKKIEEIDGGKEYLEKIAQSKSMNELVKLPDEAAESVTKLDEVEKEIAELEKEQDSEQKTVRMEELVMSKEETETEIKQFEDGQKFLDQRKEGIKTSASKKPKPAKKYCAKLPKKVFLQITLKKINEQIGSIEMDSSWCHSEYKSTRMAELLYYKDNVIQILKKFSKKDDSAEENKSEEKPAIELNDETKKLVEDLDKVQADIKELESSKTSKEVENKKAELVKSKTDLEANIKQQKSGTEFLERRDKKKDEEAPEPVKTSKKPEIPKKIMVTLKSVENQMARIEEDDRWDTIEHKKLMMKHLKKSKENIESIITKCQGGEELLAKKANKESSRIKLPKEANEQIRKLDSIEEKTEQASNWGDSGYKKKHLGSLEKSKSEIETAIKKVEKGEDYLKQRAEQKAKQEKKIQQKKEKALKDKEEKKAKMDAEKVKRRSAGGMKTNEGEDEESKPTEVEAKYPKMVVILDTLDKVDKMIEAIEREVKWCTSEIKTARVIELLRSKENIELFIRKCPGGEEALAKRALDAEAAEKRLPKLPHNMKTMKKITLPHALTVAEKLISKFKKDIASADNVRKIVLEKKLMKFKKLIDVAIEESPEYKNKKENDEEREQSKSPENSSAKDKAKPPSSQPRAVNPPKKVALISTLKTMQTITTAIEKDPTYKCSKTRLLYYQSLKQREDKLVETLNALPKEDVNSFHYKNHLKLKEAQEKRDHEMSNRKRCPEYQNIRSQFNSKSILHKPKRTILSYTLYRMGYRMNDDKRQRIRCQLGPKPMKPEDLEKALRMNAEKLSEYQDNAVKRKIKRNKDLLKKIENQIASEIFEEIAEKLKKKLPTMILNYKEPVLISDNAVKLRNSAYNMLLCSNGLPSDEESNEFYHKFAAIIADFILKTRMHCIHKGSTNNSCHDACGLNILPMEFETLKRNAKLIKKAEKLITTEQACKIPAQMKIQKSNLVC